MRCVGRDAAVPRALRHSLMQSENEMAPAPFIVGVPRSGTTLLRLMLDSHPQLAIPNESHFFFELVKRTDAEPPLASGEFHQLVVSHFTWQNFALDEDEFRAALGESRPFDIAHGIRALYRLYAARFGKQRWGEKTPDYGMLMPQIAALLPEAHFIHVVRDGRDVAVSKRHLWFGPGNDIAAQAEAWQAWIRRARDLAKSCPHYLEIRYEALVRSPREVLEQVCDFIALPFTEEMLRYHTRADARLGEVKSWANPAISCDQLRSLHELTVRPPQADRIERWRNELTAPELRTFEAVAGELLAELGYELATEAQP
ncbi:sulfotransferase [soil metagenome]